MTNLPPDVSALLQARLKCSVTRVELVGGGMIARAACVEAGGSRYFVKWAQGGLPLFFQREAEGLQALAAARALHVPAVLAYQDAVAPHDTGCLVMEYVERGRPTDLRRFTERFAAALAAQHRVASGQGCGFHTDNYLGTLPQRNRWTPLWSAFYREHRLIPQIQIAHSRGLMPERRARLLDDLLARVDTILNGCDTHASLLHGDLWSGNYLCDANGAPWVVDPAVYFGCREVELAYIELFSGFPPGFVETYREFWPLEPGYEYRRPLHQLYPLLVHLNHFGEQYGPDVEGVCHSYLRG